MYDKARSYAVNAVGNILPLDKETCTEMVNYVLTLPDYEVETHLIELLGHSEETYKLVATLSELKREEDERVEAETKAAEQKLRRAAENKGPALPVEAPNQAWSHNAPQKPTKNRLSGNRGLATTSQLADMRPSKAVPAKKAAKKNLDNLKDIEAALNDLEVEHALKEFELSLAVKRVCNCMATKHPLFEVAPNCLNCGKIICLKEGLQPCSYCGKELLSEKEKLEIIRILRSEKSVIETKLPAVQKQPEPKAPPKKIKYAMTAGGNLWKEQDAVLKRLEEEAKRLREAAEKEAERQKEVDEQEKEFKRYEREKDVNPDLLQAQERLDTLLHFQETGAERSKVIDNASDFEMPGVSSGSMWLSPVERALQLKKQQKQLRKIEEYEKTRTGRTKKVVEMVIKDGKVKMVEKHVIARDEPAEEKQIEDLQQVIRQEKLDQEVAMAKNTWDYEKEQDKWDRPIYVSHDAQPTLVVNVPKSRVQFEPSDGDELVAAIPS